MKRNEIMQKISGGMQQVKSWVMRRQRLLLVFFSAAVLLFPLISQNNYLKGMLVKVMLFSVLTTALNVINGYSGMFCLGIAGMMCIGSYTEAILATRFGISFWLLLPLAGLTTAVFGLVISIPAIRLKGIYFSIITMGFSEIVRLLAQNWTGLTGGAMGIKNIPHPSLFGMKLSQVNHYYYIVFVILALCIFTIRRIMNSKVGRAWLSIREDEAAARSLGVNLLRYKALNFFVAAFWAGVAGAFMAPYYQFIAADMYTTNESFNVLSMLIIGGQGTMVGPVVGSLVSNGLSELMRPFGDWRLVVYSVIIIATMWLRPQGIAGSSSGALTGRKKKRRQKENLRKAQRLEVEV